MTNPKRRLKILQCLSNSLTKLHSARPTGVKLDRPRRTVHPEKKKVGKTQTSSRGVSYRGLTLIYIPLIYCDQDMK